MSEWIRYYLEVSTQEPQCKWWLIPKCIVRVYKANISTQRINREPHEHQMSEGCWKCQEFHKKDLGRVGALLQVQSSESTWTGGRRGPCFCFHLKSKERNFIRSAHSSCYTSGKPPSLRVGWMSVQSCLTLCDPIICSPPGSFVNGILQARILEWVAIPFSRGSSWPRDCTWVSHIAGRFLTVYRELIIHCSI